jgi:hypothetical protein
MNEIKYKLILEARDRFKKIYPCGNNKDLIDCFTRMGNLLVFWFNTEDKSTHLMTHPVEEKMMA